MPLLLTLNIYRILFQCLYCFRAGKCLLGNKPQWIHSVRVLPLLLSAGGNTFFSTNVPCARGGRGGGGWIFLALIRGDRLHFLERIFLGDQSFFLNIVFVILWSSVKEYLLKFFNFMLKLFETSRIKLI